MKCDETKPECLRCKKFGVVCDGYICDGGVINTASSALRRVLLPAPSNHPTLLLTNPNPIDFDDEQECRYFRSFCEEVAPRIKGVFTVSSTWTAIVLQASYTESAIRHAAAATGALVRKLDITSQVISISRLGYGETEMHYTSALHYYQRALKGMREINNPRTAAIACLLVFNFETLIRRMDLAVKTAQSVFKLLNSLSASSKGPRSSGKASPISGIENELFSIFLSLDLVILPKTGITSLNCRGVLDEPHQDTTGCSVPWCPKAFPTVEDARNCLEGLLYRHAQEFKRHPTWAALTPTLHTSLSSGIMVVDFRGRHWTDSDTNSEGMEKLIQNSILWYQAFEPLLKKVTQDSDHEDFMSAILLQLHSKTSFLLLVAILAKTQCTFDQYLPHFREFLSICEIYFSRPESTKPNVSLTYGVLFPLFLIAVKCRDWTTRRKAISLLENDQIEFWDSKLLKQVAIWHMGVEEAGREFGEYIPEESRLRRGKFTLDFPHRKAWIGGLYRGIGPEDETNHIATELSW